MESAQNGSSHLGEMLLMNRTSRAPRENTFYYDPRVKEGSKLVWTLGPRNPYSFAIQPGAGRMLVNDAGVREREEINCGAKGANYGCIVCEGPVSDRRFRDPRKTTGIRRGRATRSSV